MSIGRFVRAFCCAPGIFLLSTAALWSAPPPESAGIPGAVYAMTNQTTGNSIMAFNRAPSGALTLKGTYPTGGLGFGSGNDPLGSQGSLILSNDGTYLFAVNAGSNTVSVMRVGRRGLTMVSMVSSGGTEPVSLTLYKNLLYVLNAGGTPNITGFALGPDGTLSQLPGSSRSLAGGDSAAPAQVGFSPDGSFIVVTEKDTNLIDTYRVMPNGLTQGPYSNPSSGATPFGFTFARSNTLVVSEAGGGANGTSAVSSYQIMPNGTLVTISGSVGDTQMGGCWAVSTNNGGLVYVSNSASNTLSAYTVSQAGSLTLMNATAANTGSGTVPIDMTMSSSSLYLYALDDGTGQTSGFRLQPNGTLTSVAGASGLPSGSQGIAAE